MLNYILKIKCEYRATKLIDKANQSCLLIIWQGFSKLLVSISNILKTQTKL